MEDDDYGCHLNANRVKSERVTHLFGRRDRGGLTRWMLQSQHLKPTRGVRTVRLATSAATKCCPRIVWCSCSARSASRLAFSGTFPGIRPLAATPFGRPRTSSLISVDLFPA